MRLFIIPIILSFNLCISQEDEKVSKRITLIEEYTAENYKTPDSILFYSGGHWEIEKYYDILFKRLNKEFKKIEQYVECKFEEAADIPVRLYSFDELKVVFNEDDFDAICVFALGNIDSNAARYYRKTGKTVFINSRRILYFDFFMILVESKTNRILMKRKYSIEANEKYYSQNKRLAKEIAKEIKG